MQESVTRVVPNCVAMRIFSMAKKHKCRVLQLGYESSMSTLCVTGERADIEALFTAARGVRYLRTKSI